MCSQGVIYWKSKSIRKSVTIRNLCFLDCHFGSSFFSLLACGVAVGLYFLLRPHFGMETLSWMCILGAAPFVAMGFIKYNGMIEEQFVWAWMKSEFVMPKRLLFHPENLYYESLKTTIQNYEKESLKK